MKKTAKRVLTASKPIAKKSASKTPIKATKVSSMSGTTVGSPGGGWRLAGNHNETLLTK
jgi:hypothetical protein